MPSGQKERARSAPDANQHAQRQVQSEHFNVPTFQRSNVPTFHRFHSLVWLVWLVAAVLAVSSNPLLNLLVLVQAVLVALLCRSDSPVGRALGLFGWLAVVLILVRTLLSAVPIGGVTYGATPLFTVPRLQLPIW